MLSSKMAIYAATSPVDLRRSFDGLAAAAQEALGHDPKSGALFPFVNKAGNRVKALWWDRTGYCLLYKRLERGTFRIPAVLRPGETSIALDAQEFTKILEALDLGRRRTANGDRRAHGASAELGCRRVVALVCRRGRVKAKSVQDELAA